MKPAVRKEFLWGLALVGCMIMLLLYWGPANATGDQCWLCQGEPGIDGVDGLDGVDGYNGMDIGISSSDFAEGLSLSFAMAGMDFTSTTTKLQLGVSGGWYDGENAAAFGVAQVVDSANFGDVMLALKVGVANSETGGSVSAVWNIK